MKPGVRRALIAPAIVGLTLAVLASAALLLAAYLGLSEGMVLMRAPSAAAAPFAARPLVDGLKQLVLALVGIAGAWLAMRAPVVSATLLMGVAGGTWAQPHAIWPVFALGALLVLPLAVDDVLLRARRTGGA